MAICAYCKTQETQLYERGVPICLECEDIRKSKLYRTASVRVILQRDLQEATLQAESASTAFNAVISDIPSSIPQPDGTQRINNASRALKAARDKMMIAQRRLNDFLEHGIVPDDLKRSG